MLTQLVLLHWYDWRCNGLYPNDSSIYDSTGRLLMIAFFVIV